MRVVGTLTTLPDRYPHLRRTLATLSAQTRPLDVIYLGLPKLAKRLNQPYPPLPSDIAALVTVVPCEDYGPITKLMGALLSENDPSTIILSFDDDHFYPPTLVQDLLVAHKRRPDAAICSTGCLVGYRYPFYGLTLNSEDSGLWKWITEYDVPPGGRDVDIIFGLGGVLYLRRFFPPVQDLYNDLLRYTDLSPDLFRNDDILISAYLNHEQVPRLVMPNIAPVPSVVRKREGDELSYDQIKFWKSFNQALRDGARYSLLTTSAPVSLYETVGFRILIVLVVVGLLVIGLYLLWRNYR